MISEQVNIYEYEQILLGKRDRFEVSMQGSVENNRVEAGNIWRYAIEHLLHWSPKIAADYMTTEIVNMLCLDKTFSAIGFKKTNNFVPDYKFIIQYAFPDSNECKLDIKYQAMEEYKHVAKLGKWAADCIPYKYPKKFFCGENGIERAKYLLRYVVNQYLEGTMSHAEMYAFFANRRKSKRWLVSKCLESPVTIMYETPLDYFHFSMPRKSQDDFLYNVHRINEMYKEKLSDMEPKKRRVSRKTK